MFDTDFTILTRNLPDKIQENLHVIMRGSRSLLLLRIFLELKSDMLQCSKRTP